MTWSDPNTVGQIYRIPDGQETMPFRREGARLCPGDLLLCLKHTGDCHYTWARLDYETRTQSPNYFLSVNCIKNYYVVGQLFFGYAIAEEWSILEEPLGDRDMLDALIAMATHSGSGLLLPLFPWERAEYLGAQEESRKESAALLARHANPQQEDGWPRLKRIDRGDRR